MTSFAEAIAAGYTSEGSVVDLGRGVHEGAVVPEAKVGIPLAMMNRHGLVAGATGTGKTKTLQGITEQLSAAGVPVFVADVKGDLSGLAAPGDPAGPAGKRNAELGIPYEPTAFPVEFLSIGGIGPGVPIRATAPTWARRCSERSSAPTRPRSRASRSSSTTRTRKACRCWTSRICGRC